MKILFFSDLQCAVTNLPQCRMVFEQVTDLLKKWKPNGRYVVFLGDAKDARGALCDVRVTNFLIEGFKRIVDDCEGLYFVRGNHDSIATPDGVPSLVPWVRAAGAAGVADDDWADAFFSLRPDVGLWMVPYFRDPKRQRDSFRGAAADANASGKKVRILAFHQEIEGCQRDAHTKGRGLTLSDMRADEYSLCVGGHIHRPQFLRPNVYYCGSPFPTSWSEANVTHRLLTVEI